MKDPLNQFLAELHHMEEQIHVLNSYLQTLAERERRMKTLQAEIDRLRETLDELRRHA